MVRPPATTRSGVALASPARTNSTICGIVTPCARRIASVQPSRHDASNSSARRRAGLGRRAIGSDSSTLGLSRAHRLAVGPPFEAETDRALHALAEIFIHADQALARPCDDDALPVPAAFPILRHDGTQGRIGLHRTKVPRPA